MPDTQTIMDLYNKKEELHKDLAWYLHTDPRLGWTVLKHPLVFSIPYNEMMNAMLNQSYLTKRKAIVEYELKGDWGGYIFMHERPYRFEAFWKIKDQMTDHEYWKHLAEVWTDSENLWQQKKILPKLLSTPRSGKDSMMTAEEKKLFDSLPDQFAIHRGFDSKHRNRSGWSWSLSYWKAAWFSSRYRSDKKISVVSGTVDKDRVLALFTGRGEYEIVVEPQFVRPWIGNSVMWANPTVQGGQWETTHPSVEGIKENKQLWISKLLKQLKLEKSFPLGFRSLHGPWHWDKVEYNAEILSYRTEGSDSLVANLFAIFHDCKRKDENVDIEHGSRAGEFVKDLWVKKKLPITSSQMDTLEFALVHHSAGTTSDDPTIGVCFDADRLDLLRVGTIPDKKYLSTKAAKDLLWRI